MTGGDPGKKSRLAGDPSRHAFVAEQYRQHGAAVFKRCLVMAGGDAAWAEDVTHDVFVRLAEKADSLDDSEPLLGWLLTVAYRLSANKLRHERSLWRRVAAVLAADGESSAPAVEHDPDPSALGPRLQASLATLPARERAVVVMRYLDGMAQKHIARALECSEGYVSKLLSRALARLRQLDWEVDAP